MKSSRILFFIFIGRVFLLKMGDYFFVIEMRDIPFLMVQNHFILPLFY